jgi:chromosome segregation ATPase
MGREEELEKEIKALEAQLRDREASLPAHSVRPQQMLVIEQLEAGLEEKKKELEELRRKRESGSQVD